MKKTGKYYFHYFSETEEQVHKSQQIPPRNQIKDGTNGRLPLLLLGNRQSQQQQGRQQRQHNAKGSSDAAATTAPAADAKKELVRNATAREQKSLRIKNKGSSTTVATP